MGLTNKYVRWENSETCRTLYGDGDGDGEGEGEGEGRGN